MVPRSRETRRHTPAAEPRTDATSGTAVDRSRLAEPAGARAAAARTATSTASDTPEEKNSDTAHTGVIGPARPPPPRRPPAARSGRPIRGPRGARTAGRCGSLSNGAAPACRSGREDEEEMVTLCSTERPPDRVSRVAETSGQRCPSLKWGGEDGSLYGPGHPRRGER